MTDGLARVCLVCAVLTTACAGGDRAATDAGSSGASSRDGAASAKCADDRVWPSIIVRARATQTNAVLVIGQWVGGGAVRRGLLRDDGAAGFCPIATPAPLAEVLPGRGGQIWGLSEGAGSILMSSDDGKSWQDAWDATLGAPRRLLDSATTDELWATLGDGTLVLTRDRGKTWARVISPGDPRLEPGTYVFDVKATLDPQHPGRVYLAYGKIVATSNDPQLGLARSDDFGATFRNLTVPDPKLMAGTLGVDGGGALFLVRAPNLWRSVDAGQTWAALPALTGIDPSVTMVSTKKDHLALVTEFSARAWESTDGGTSFQQVEFPADPSRVRVLLAGPQPGGFSVWSPRGLERTQDRGKTWSVALASPAGASAVTFTGGARPRLLAAGTDALTWSDDQGRTYTSQRTPWTTPLLNLFTVSSGDLYAVTAGAVYRSSDVGATWTSILDAPSGAQFLRADVAADGGTLAVAVPGRILCSTDRGASWSGYDVMFGAVDPRSGLTAIAVDPGRAGRVLLGMFARPVPIPLPQPSSLYESVDGCRSFAAIPGTTQVFRSLVFVQGTVIASAESAGGSQPLGIVRSEDGGRTWTPSGDGLDLGSAGGVGPGPAGAGGLQVMLLGLGHGPLVAVRGDVIHVGSTDGRTWRRLTLPGFDPPPNMLPANVVAPRSSITAVTASAGVPDSVFVLFGSDPTPGMPPSLTAYSGVSRVAVH